MRGGKSRKFWSAEIEMSDTWIIIMATTAIVAYFALTKACRKVAERDRLVSLNAAKELLVSPDTPESVKKFLGNKDVLGAHSFAPWVVALALPFVAIGSLVSKRDDRILDDAHAAGPETERLFDLYLDTSTKSTIFRSPAALVIACVEIAIMASIFLAASLFLAKIRGLDSVFTYLQIRIDDYDTGSLLSSVHRH